MLIQFVKPSVTFESKPVMPVQEMAKITEFIYEFWPDDIQYEIEISFPICLIQNDVFKFLKDQHKIVVGCPIQFGSGISFDTKGRILPCNHFINLPYDNEPHLTTDSIRKLLEGEAREKVKKVACSYPSMKCKDCENWNICGGGCFTRWFYEKPEEIIG